MKEGVVTKSTGSWYIVNSENTIYNCRIIGKFRLGKLKLTNPVAVGDLVKFEVEDNEEGNGLIKEILPRKNYVVRQSPRKKHNVHLLASNIDQACLIVTVVEPKLKQGFIDRFLVMTEPYDIDVIIVFNKSDLYEEKDFETYQQLRDIYEKIGYTTCLCSADNGEGIKEIRDLLNNKTTMIAGQSGVGKSTIINQLADNIDLRTQDLSDYSGKGQHTTTFAERFTIAPDTHIIDTPGIKTLSFNHMEVMDIAHNFKEFFVLSKDCKFANCLHRNEPNCAVKLAIEEGEVSEWRYVNYLQIAEEIEDQNYWERHTDI